MSMTPQLSVVIPAFNEAGVIRSTLEAVAGYLGAAGIAHEILVVDDGSTDQTRATIRSLQPAIPGLRLLESPHAGKGGAVKRGMLEASGAWVLFMDADHSTRIGEWAACAPWCAAGYDVVIGSRKMPGARVLVRQPPLREAMGKAFTWLTNALLAARVSDITCGFKAFRADAARRIFGLQRLCGWGFDAEILFIARRLGCRIKEVPVAWTNDATTKVRLAQDAIRSLLELVQIRLGAWRGWYPVAAPGTVAPVDERAVSA